MRFSHPDQAISRWAELKQRLQLRASDPSVPVGDMWAKECPRSGCSNVEHTSVWNDRIGDYVERCLRCNARWPKIELREIKQPRHGHAHDPHWKLLSFHELDSALASLCEKNLSIYVAYVCHPARISGSDHAIDYMRRHRLRLYRNFTVALNRKTIEEWVDDKRRKTQILLQNAGMWRERIS